MAQFCTQCGSELKPGSKFCMVCGKKIEDDLTGNRVAPNVPNSVNQNKSTGNSNNIMIVALIVVLVVIGGICGYFFLGRSTGNKNTSLKPQSNPTQQIAKPVESVPAPKPIKTGFIVGVNVNARDKASIDSAVVGNFDLGEKVTIIADEPEWAKVKRADGKECYVFKKFLGTQEDLDKRKALYNKKSGSYPVYLNGDPNYILVDGHMGSAWYIIKNSVRREQDSPGTWHIQCQVVSATETGKTSSGSPMSYTFFFDENKGTGAIAQKGLLFFNYNGPRSETMVVNGAAAMAYYIAMGKKWPQFGFDNEFYSYADL